MFVLQNSKLAVLSDAIWGQRLFLTYMCGLWHQTDLREASSVLKFVLNTKTKSLEGVMSWKEENTVSDVLVIWRWTVVYQLLSSSKLDTAATLLKCIHYLLFVT